MGEAKPTLTVSSFYLLLCNTLDKILRISLPKEFHFTKEMLSVKKEFEAKLPTMKSFTSDTLHRLIC